MPLPLEGITRQRDQSRPVGPLTSGVQSTSTPADQSCPSASRNVSWSLRFCAWWRISRTARCRSTTSGGALPRRSGCRRDRPRPGRGSDRQAARRVRRRTARWPVSGAPMSPGWSPRSADIGVPVMFDSKGICGSRNVSRDRNAVNSGITGSINREWNACDVRTRRATMPVLGEARPGTCGCSRRIPRPRSCPDR